MKRWAIGLGVLALSAGPAAHAGGEQTTQQDSYIAGPFFVENCGAGIGVACFTINRDDLTALDVVIDDASPLPVTAHVTFYGPGNVQIGSGDQFCDSTRITTIPHGMIFRIDVHVGGFMQDECGPIPFFDPFEQKTGSLAPATTGTVRVSY